MVCWHSLRCGRYCGCAVTEDSVKEILGWIFQNPEKGALFIVVVAGGWRIIREIIKDVRGNSKEETLIETLLKENHDLRAENHELRKERRD